jgi:hypothetical protein
MSPHSSAKMLLVLTLLSPWMAGVFSDRASADVRAVLVCRQLPPGPGRSDCLERASADLEREASRPAATSQAVAPSLADKRSNDLKPYGRVGVASIAYQDGKPIFRLSNGQTWYSRDRRRLTFRPGRSSVTIEKTPVGMLLHYNGSFFGLQVVLKNG